MSSNIDEWTQKLVGKKYLEGQANTESTDSFSDGHLPKPSRVVKSGGMFTMDHNPERLNVHLDEKDVCNKVTLG